MKVHWSSVRPQDVQALRPQYPGHVIEHASLKEVDPGDAAIWSIMPTDSVDEAMLDAHPALRAIITRSDGFDHIPVAACHERDVAVYHLEGYATESVGHLALAFILMGLRRIPEATGATRGGLWNRDDLVGKHLGEVTVGLIGTGRIGGRLAQLLCAMGATVHAFDLVHQPALDALAGFQYLSKLEDVLRTSEVVSLHVPLTPETSGMLAAPQVAMMPEKSILVNTARAGLVDEAAVLEALDAGHLALYCTDVLHHEPSPDMTPWLHRDNVVVTPHLGAHNAMTLARRYRISGEIARQLASGVPVASQYNVGNP